MRSHLALDKAVVCLTLSIVIASFVEAHAAWLDTGWPKRIEMVVDPSQVTGAPAVAGVTLLVDLSHPDLMDLVSMARPDGGDLIVTGADGLTILPHELVSFDPLAGNGELWFRADSLSVSADRFYLYYGNVDTLIASSADSAWSSDHLAVYHFDDDPGVVTQVSDSGPGDGDNPASIGSGSSWSSSDLVAGQIGNGWNFDGTEDWLRAQSISSSDSSFTISAWFADVRSTQEGMTALQALSEYWDISFRRNFSNPRADLRTAHGGMIFEPLFEDSLMHHHVWTLDAEADTARFFVDGDEIGVYASQVFGAAAHAFQRAAIQGQVGIAGPVFFNVPDLTNGVVDEFRIIEGIQSPELIHLQHANQTDPGAFFTYTSQSKDVLTAAGPAVNPSIASLRVWPNPSQGRVFFSVDLDVPSLDLTVYDLAGRRIRSLRSTSFDGLHSLRWDGRDESGGLAASGIYYLRVLGGSGQAINGKVVLRR